MNQEKIGKYIYEQRIKNNLTQKELADKLSVTSQAVSKWENGRGIPDIEQLTKLSEIFNVDIKDIINGRNTIKKKNYKYIIIILLFIILVFLFFILNKEDNFNFKTINSDNSCFGVKGVVAFNKNKKSIYISSIECSNEEESIYLDVECILYEKNNNIEKIIYENGKIDDFESYDIENKKTLNELLKDLTFNIDNYDCSCGDDICNNLYLRVNALNIDNKVITYNIPLELEKKCF